MVAKAKTNKCFYWICISIFISYPHQMNLNGDFPCYMGNFPKWSPHKWLSAFPETKSSKFWKLEFPEWVITSWWPPEFVARPLVRLEKPRVLCCSGYNWYEALGGGTGFCGRRRSACVHQLAKEPLNTGLWYRAPSIRSHTSPRRRTGVLCILWVK